MILDGITFAGKHSFKDFGFAYEKGTLSTPVLRKTEQKLAFGDGNADTGEGQYYDNRTYTVILAKLVKTQSQVDEAQRQINAWMFGTQSGTLIDDRDSGYELNVDSITSITPDYQPGILKFTIIFSVKPKKCATKTVQLASISVPAGTGNMTSTVTNPYAMRTHAIISSTTSTKIKIRDDQQIQIGPTANKNATLNPGTNAVTLTKAASAYTVTIKAREETL